MSKNELKSWLITGFLAMLLCFFTGATFARTYTQTSSFETISVTELPKQGQRVYELIASGGPFVHEKDGVVFGNRERILPANKRGYYREYTVRTSGVRSRGARRIVCGGLQVERPEACYYTDDHYASFRKIIN